MPSVASATAFLDVIKPHLAALDAFLHAQLAEFEPEVRDLVAYCIDTSGKRIRPALVFFSGWQADGSVAEPLVRLAAVIEMVHLATLVHDDIMDGAKLRRNRATASREFGPDTAVLLGDALLAHAVHVAAQFPTTEVCREVSRATRRVCSGEIMQTLADREMDRTRAHYQRVIELKTAELFRVSCCLGAQLDGADPERAAAVGRFGNHLGTAYQVYDDLADFFGEERKIGKTLGTDLASGKTTLPLLLLLDALPAEEAAVLRQEMGSGDTGNIGRWVSRMSELGVFSKVLGTIRDELAGALSALEEAGPMAGAAWLTRMAGLLEVQAGALAPG